MRRYGFRHLVKIAHLDCALKNYPQKRGCHWFSCEKGPAPTPDRAENGYDEGLLRHAEQFDKLCPKEPRVR